MYDQQEFNINDTVWPYDDINTQIWVQTVWMVPRMQVIIVIIIIIIIIVIIYSLPVTYHLFKWWTALLVVFFRDDNRQRNTRLHSDSNLHPSSTGPWITPPNLVALSAGSLSTVYTVVSRFEFWFWSWLWNCTPPLSLAHDCADDRDLLQVLSTQQLMMRCSDLPLVHKGHDGLRQTSLFPQTWRFAGLGRPSLPARCQSKRSSVAVHSPTLFIRSVATLPPFCASSTPAGQQAAADQLLNLSDCELSRKWSYRQSRMTDMFFLVLLWTKLVLTQTWPQLKDCNCYFFVSSALYEPNYKLIVHYKSANLFFHLFKSCSGDGRGNER